MAGERLRAARLDGRGLGGDRTHALLDAGDRRLLTASRAPRLLGPALLRHLHRARAGLFGINARVLVPGRVAVGDHATVAPP
jgi:uncharacterized protein YcbX